MCGAGRGFLGFFFGNVTPPADGSEEGRKEKVERGQTQEYKQALHSLQMGGDGDRNRSLQGA